ncbi:MAG: DUF4391 domain-containing protein, partial [Desulfobacterales bacterium]
MTHLFSFPQSAKFDRRLPKKKIYEYANPAASIKGLFVRQVDQIVWQYKLAPKTVNIPHTRSVPEIEIFRIDLKDGGIKYDVLRSIDRAIPYPIIYEAAYDGRIKGIAAYKRPSEADAAKWVVSNYFETDWLPENVPRKPLPMVLDLGRMYEYLLSSLMPYPARPGEGLQAMVERMERIRTQQKAI